MANAAEALGMKAERVEDPDEIAPSLKRALKETRANNPAYIEVICSKYPVHGEWLTQ
jgi:thiamine pyrophosphate-dependent acetolactate synthase large subunit-like protein